MCLAKDYSRVGVGTSIADCSSIIMGLPDAEVCINENLVYKGFTGSKEVYCPFLERDHSLLATIGRINYPHNSCPDSNPTDNGDGTCSSVEEPPTCQDDEYLDEETNTCLPIKSCPESGTFAKKLYGKSGFQGYTVCFSGCVIEATIDVVQLCTGAGSADESCDYDALYTGASCIEGDGQPHPPGYEYPTNPNPQPPTDPTAPLPPDNLPGTPDSTPEPTPTPKPNPNPTPDPINPDLGDGDSAIVQKIDVSNQYLENIDVGIDNLIQANNQNSKENINYQKFILGELQSGIGSGGGGSGDGEGDGGLNFGEPEFTNPFEDILSAQDIADINQKTDDVKGLINQKINSFKSLVSTPNYGLGGEVQGVVVEANHYGQSIKMEQNFLARSSAEFSTIILLICGIIAFGVVARR